MLCALRQPCLHALELEVALAELGPARERLLELEDELARLKRWTFGPKSERLPSIDEELRDHAEEDEAEDAAEQAANADVEVSLQPELQAQDASAQEEQPASSPTEQAAAEGQDQQHQHAAAEASTVRQRRKRRQQKKELPTRAIHHAVPPEQRRCPECGSEDLYPLGPGKISYLYERLKEAFERQQHIQEVLACRCGSHVVTAPPAPRIFDKAQYGPRLVGDVVTSKVAESTPLYRLARRYKSSGFELARSTMVDLFHRAAELTAPISQHLVRRVAQQEIVLGDETPIPVMSEHKTRKGWIWIFRTVGPAPLLAYVFSPSRSGETPQQVLANTTGILLVDAYTGYNVVTVPGGRLRAGCMAHARRKIFDARAKAPVANEALKLIRKLYRVEAEAKKRGVLGQALHQRLRDLRSRPVLEKLKKWLEEQQELHLPKGSMGKAIQYMLDNWEALTVFLRDPRIPIDNNLSEAALRIIALGRKNFMWVGNDQAGRNIAGLYSLVMTCVANNIDPREYLADVLIRVQTHPQSRIDELLPVEWAKRRAAGAK